MKLKPDISIVDGDNEKEIFAHTLGPGTYQIYARIGHDLIVCDSGTATLEIVCDPVPGAGAPAPLTVAGAISDAGPREIILAAETDLSFTLRSSIEFGTVYCEWIDTVFDGGAEGPAGPQGVTGPVGPTGAQGPQGIPGSVEVNVSGTNPLTGLVGSPTLVGVVDD